jgi:branched-chain amino acid transport system permease protein
MEIEGVRTVAPDLPNFGQSDHLESADIDLYADYLCAFIRDMGLATPLPVVGHSLGGAVAISLTLRNPDLVSRLMLVDSAPLEGLKTPEEHYPVIEMYKSNRELLSQALQAVTPTMNDPDFLSRLTETAMQMNPIAFAGNARALERFDYRGKGAEFAGEVLVVAGEKDPLISREMAQSTADSFPRGRLQYLQGVGHSVMVEAPATFIALLREFLQA